MFVLFLLHLFFSSQNSPEKQKLIDRYDDRVNVIRATVWDCYQLWLNRKLIAAGQGELLTDKIYVYSGADLDASLARFEPFSNSLLSFRNCAIRTASFARLTPTEIAFFDRDTVATRTAIIAELTAARAAAMHEVAVVAAAVAVVSNANMDMMD